MMMKMISQWMFPTALYMMMAVGLVSCDNGDKPKVVVCVPVYGQSLAMGEEAELVTDIG